MKGPEDKNAYMTFLEIQLERVSQTCLAQQSNNEKMTQLSSKVNLQEEKVVNISRLVKLLQSYSDAQEDDTSNLKRQVMALEQKVNEFSRDRQMD